MLGSTARPTTDSPEDPTVTFDDKLQNANKRTLPESDDDLCAKSNMLQALEDAISSLGNGPQNKTKDNTASITLRDPHWDNCKAMKTKKGGALNCTYRKNVNHGSVT
ncbi:hypothetical protein HDU80_000460 [Chytriomyces hyalinus]|nr:hypothetical protein HDU80_000460 [Chytriomyces hyalinus]